MPVPGEGVNDAIPVEAPAGSVIVFHGNVWHGAFPKATDGLRLSVNAFYCGPQQRTQETFQHLVDAPMLERNPPRLRSLVGYDDPWGFDDARGPVPYHQRATSRAPGEAT
jgi:ectoine hydroxylase-related dioxygenase (phytanoyl-CoA dioxygenase family)